jgi:transcription antitermination factor NusG
MDEKWVVVYTRANFEKKIAHKLYNFKIDYYLPIHRVRKQWKDRKKWVDELLFRSYLFVKYSDYELYKDFICKIEGFIRVLYSNGKPLFVSQIEIENLKNICSDKYSISIETTKPKEGDVIFLQDFKVEGIISNISKTDKISIYIPSLNYYVTVSYQEIK